MSVPQRLRGLAASPGRAVGPGAHVIRGLTEPAPVVVVDTAAECARARSSAAAVRTHLEGRAGSATGVARSILELTALIAEDPTLLSQAERLILDHSLNAASAVWQAGAELAANMRAVGGSTAERASDVLDVRDRIVAHLAGLPAPGIPELSEPHVLIADDLAPADTAILDPDLIIAIVTAQGGPTSHTAILARELGIPAVVACVECLQIPPGTRIAVDGSEGQVLLAVVDEDHFLASRPPTFEYRGPCLSADGHRIEMLANVGDLAGARVAAELGADGIGLLCTEYTFPPNVAPSVEEQAEMYGEVFALFPGRRVVVRTLDAGADKPLAYLTQADEPNPALGVRGYRAMVRHPDVLADQLEAIRRAAEAHEAEVWVMAPMITTPDEAERFTRQAHDAGLPMAGVMIEVPAAAVRAPQVLARTDFASIGTNDLTQYAMAADRTLGTLARFGDPWDPAVLSLVRLTAQGGTMQGRPAGVCGEAASDPALAAVLLGLGVTSLSMSPRSLAAVATLLGRITIAEMVQLAEMALSQDSAAAAHAAVRTALPVLSELGL